MINAALNTVLSFNFTIMAYGGKSDSSSLGNVPTTSTVNLKYISARNADDSASAVVDVDAFNSPRFKDNRHNKGFNSGTRCTSTAFTPLGKPSALSTSKNTANRKHLSSGISVNDSSKPPAFESRPNKLFNYDTPCTSKALTPLGKPSAITAANLTEIIPRNAVKDSNSPPIKYPKSNPTNQSIMRHDVALEKSSTMCNVGAKEFTSTKTVNDSKSTTIKYNKSNTTHQNIMKYYTALENSSIIRPVEAKDFIPRKAVNDSKSPPLSVEDKDFIPKEAVNNPKSPPLKETKSGTTHPDMLEYYSFLRRSSAVSSKSFMLRKSSNDSKSSTSETEHQTTFNKHYTRPSRKSYPSESTSGNLTDFNFGSRISQDSCSTQVSSKIGENRASPPVDLLRCIICIDKERDTVFQPCGHLIVCSKCANSIQSTCPTCRKRIKKKIKAYIN